MYTFRKDPDRIRVISENGYEIPWGKNGTIPDEAYRLCNLSEELGEDFYEWTDEMNSAERIDMKNEFFNKGKKSVHELTVEYFSTFSASTPYKSNNDWIMGIKKEEENMNTTTRFEDTQEGKAQYYVLRRANEAFQDKTAELEKHYGLRDDNAPGSWNELVKRIKDGKFKISDEHAKLYSYDPTNYVEWRDPKIEKDHEGFDKSMEKLKKLMAETKDIIIVKSAADGLEMIEKIQNFKH